MSTRKTILKNSRTRERILLSPCAITRWARPTFAATRLCNYRFLHKGIRRKMFIPVRQSVASIKSLEEVGTIPSISREPAVWTINSWCRKVFLVSLGVASAPTNLKTSTLMLISWMIKYWTIQCKIRAKESSALVRPTVYYPHAAMDLLAPSTNIGNMCPHCHCVWIQLISSYCDFLTELIDPTIKAII